MFTSVLIANRGEIAVRIIKTARRLGLRTIAVYSQADRGAMHVAMADEAHEIGAAEATHSYLRGERILEVARRTGAECIHPGYGFLSENAEFAEACAQAGVAFVGPPPAAIRAMGLKDAAKRLMAEAGVPVVPGYHGVDQDEKFLAGAAEEIGYPVLIKAVAGGGGKGMRKVERAGDFAEALAAARREAANAFGDERVLVEKFVARPRHVEIQVFADGHGNAVHLFERDCSLQRRHQKVVEEAPAPGMGAAMREAMGEAAVTAAKAVGYVGAGTVEFIADASEGLRTDAFFFMEMNTRLQVEHPVTEMISGVDLVEWQLRVAAGAPLPAAQGDLAPRGHAVEVRLYAEDPASGFLPSTGQLLGLDMRESADGMVRVDTGVREGDRISRYYDPMIAKVIAWGENRDQAAARLADALGDMVVAGVKTNLGFLLRVLRHKAFRDGEIDTGFIERWSEDLVAAQSDAPELAAALWLQRAIAAARRDAALAGEPAAPWHAKGGWQLGSPRASRVELVVNGAPCACEVAMRDGALSVTAVDDGGGEDDGAAEPAVEIAGLELGEGSWRAMVGERPVRGRWIAAGETLYVMVDGRQIEVRAGDPLDRDAAAGAGGGIIRAPMPGRLQTLAVAVGDTVANGDRIAVLEAMKMEHTLRAGVDGTVSEIGAGEGDQVEEGRVLVVLEPAAPAA